MARSADFDLRQALAKPGFTPGQRDIPALLDLVATDEAPAKAAPALASLGAAATTALITRIGEATDEGALAKLLSVLGLRAREADSAARAELIARVGDARVRVRRAAIVALGKLGAVRERDATDDLDDARAALLARWDAGDAPPEEQRSLAEALGKLGGEGARERLAKIDASADRELARRRDRAVLMSDREAQRGEESSIATDRAPAQPLRVRLSCRAGVAELLAEEVAKTGQKGLLVRDDSVDITLAAPWSSLYALRLWITAAIRIDVPALRAAKTKEKQHAAIVAAILAQRPLLTAWTRGPIRWRLQMAAGHQRGVVWNVARDVTTAAPEMINDPTQTTWDIRVDADEGTLELLPRRADDPRFTYRVDDVPAASHPTIAAALVWASSPKATDRVWDPFCGAGGELIERAMRAPAASITGSDIDPDALAAARANIDAAKLAIDLHRADARDDGPQVDAIITNPPLGSRVHVDAGALLCECLPRFASRLTRGGRLVWITPQSRRTSPVAEGLGLVLGRSLPVDLGGIRGRLERWNKH
ncbi:MAG TPA: methyltransferase [Kofleriaceae bacterium]